MEKQEIFEVVCTVQYMRFPVFLLSFFLIESSWKRGCWWHHIQMFLFSLLNREPLIIFLSVIPNTIRSSSRLRNDEIQKKGRVRSHEATQLFLPLFSFPLHHSPFPASALEPFKRFAFRCCPVGLTPNTKSHIKLSTWEFSAISQTIRQKCHITTYSRRGCVSIPLLVLATALNIHIWIKGPKISVQAVAVVGGEVLARQWLPCLHFFYRKDLKWRMSFTAEFMRSLIARRQKCEIIHLPAWLDGIHKIHARYSLRVVWTSNIRS